VGHDSSFEELLREGASVEVAGWDFSWFEGRATEERPSWGYTRLLTQRLSGARSVLDIQTGGGEVFGDVLSRLDRLPSIAAATESWPPNVSMATRNLAKYAVSVTQVGDEEALPYANSSFDFVISRHPTTVNWVEIARVLGPGGTHLSQLVGPGTNRELTEFMMGVQPTSAVRSPDRAVRDAKARGLDLVDLAQESLRVEFFDIAAVVYFLRKVVWTVPGFTVARYRNELLRLHRLIENEGPFVSHSERYLMEVVKTSG
jgi:SAM-dependent methyltransferase